MRPAKTSCSHVNEPPMMIASTYPPSLSIVIVYIYIIYFYSMGRGLVCLTSRVQAITIFFFLEDY